MVLAFDLLPVQLAEEACDVGVGRVSSGLKEVRLDGEIFLGCNNVPHLEMIDHRPNVFFCNKSSILLAVPRTARRWPQQWI